MTVTKRILCYTMNKNYYPVLTLIVWALLLGGCSTPPAASPLTSNPYPGPQGLPLVNQTLMQTLVAPIGAPQPGPGKASISGVLYSYTMSRVLPGTMFYLTRAVGNDNRTMPTWLIGPEVEKGDIRGWTDVNGQFALNNIPPGNYYLIIWAPYDWIPAENSSDDPTPRLIELGENQREPLGVVYVPWR